MRLMHFFYVSKHMGPYVVMIGRMVRDDSYWISFKYLAQSNTPGYIVISLFGVQIYYIALFISTHDSYPLHNCDRYSIQVSHVDINSQSKKGKWPIESGQNITGIQSNLAGMLWAQGMVNLSGFITIRLYRPVASIKWLGGAERVAHINSPPPRFGPSVKAYFLVHVRSLHLSTIPFVLVSNFPFVLTLTK